MIQNSAVLVDLNISVWMARKIDKRVSEEIDASKHTQARAGNYHKKLLAGTEALDNLQRLVSAIRVWHYGQTLPWADSGSRLLPMKNFFEYKATLGDFEKQFEESCEALYVEYPTLVTAAAFKLGDLFSSDEYPDVDKIRTKNRFRAVFSPVPDAGDFRVDVAEDSKQELIKQYDEFYKAKVNEAMQDAWDRLHACLTKMSEKLDGTEKQIFRDSLVGNAVDMCELLTRLNVTNDAKLEDARKKLESALVGVTATELRKDTDLRKDVKSRVDEILSMF